jgi:hypothetical protein
VASTGTARRRGNFWLASISQSDCQGHTQTAPGITSFPNFLPQIGHGSWAQFTNVASTPPEVSISRPFYPARPGGTLQSHLYDGLGLTRQQIRRRCDGSDAEAMFGPWVANKWARRLWRGGPMCRTRR